MWEGGIGLRSARRSQPAAHWASWADALKMVKERHPIVADTILGALESGAETNSIQAILKCSQILCDAGFESPAWGELAEGRVPEAVEEEEDPCQPRFGWQQKASSAIEKHHFKVSVWPQLLEHERAMMRSQSGPLASTPFVSFPVDRTSRIDAGPFRALLLRRLRLPLPLSVRRCRCGRLLDALGHHRAACATAGVLGRRGWALESVAARVCREGGARVRANVFVRDMDLAEHSRLDCRRLEVVADGLPLFGGVQLAIDTTMVSPLHRDGRARRGTAQQNGKALEEARRRKERTYPELAGEGGRARLIVLGAEVGGRWSEETAEFLSSLAWAKVRELPEELQAEARRAWLRRWQRLLACTAAKAFSMSLLGLVPGGSDGATPSVHEVLCEARHA